MLNLDLLNTDENDSLGKYSLECLPFEEDLGKTLKDTQGKTQEEIEKQWAEEDEKTSIKSKEYMEHIDDLRLDLLNNGSDEKEDEYSSSEEFPTCNPWRD